MSDSPRLIAIVACTDPDAAEQWWNRLGFSRPDGRGDDQYRMLRNDEGGEIHLNRDECGWVKPGENPHGVYLYTPRVDELAGTMPDAIIEPAKKAEHKAWGMYEFALNGPDDLLVRIGWPSRLIDPERGVAEAEAHPS